MTLGEALRQYRKRQKLVQKELAARIGISLKHYALIERNKAHPSHAVLERICAVTTISINYTLDTKTNRVLETIVRYKLPSHR